MEKNNQTLRKGMSKEEIIEYFIVLLGDNEILGEIMPIDQIRNKLNRIIKEITYEDEPDEPYKPYKILAITIPQVDGTVNINFDELSNITIVHELLHALSFRSSLLYDNSKHGSKMRLENSGIHLCTTTYPVDHSGYLDRSRGRPTRIDK